MRTGVAIPTTGTAGNVVAWARAAEECGFDSLAVAGRVTHDSYEPLVTLSLVAAATRRVELITHVQAGPLRHRGVLARQAASLSRTSSRRLTVGVGLDADYRLLEGTSILAEHLDELTGRPTVVAGDPQLAARVLATAGRGWVMTSGTAADFAAGHTAVHDAWACAGRPGRPRGIALLSTDGDLVALRDQLDAFELAGADDVLISAPGHLAQDLAQLDRVADAALRAPALV